MSNKTISKSDLVSRISSSKELSKTVVKRVLEGFQEQVKEELANGNQVVMQGFMSMSTVDKAERQGRNPTTGDPLTIPAKTAVKIKAGKGLKEAVN